MLPILYKRDETDFNHNGLGIMADCLSAVATEELNGKCELKVVYDLDGPLANAIDNELIIKAKMNDKQDDQLFRIYSFEKDQEESSITINAQHITYDLGNNFVERLEVTDMSRGGVMGAIQNNLAYPTRFELTGDGTTTSSTKLYRNNPLQMIAGVDGSVLDKWGGEILRDNFHLAMLSKRGTDDGVLVAYKKNLTGLHVKFDLSSVVTRIFPFKQDSDGNLITLSEKFVDSPHINDYSFIRIAPVDYSNDESVTDEASLRAASENYFTDGTHKDLPNVSLEVNFESLWNTEEYKDLAVLERVGMGDTVTVRNSEMGYDGQSEVISIEFDVIAEANLTVKTGDHQTKFTQSMSGVKDTVISAANDAREIAGRAILAANGKNHIYYSIDEPTGNLVEGDLWFEEIDGEIIRMHRYDGVQWQLVVSKDANDALNRANEAMQSANGKAQVWRQAEEPTSGMKENDIWFRENADGTITQFTYTNGAWTDPIDSGVKAAQDRANDAVARADAATEQAGSAIDTATDAVNTANQANTTAQAAQQAAGDAASLAQGAQSSAEDAMDDAQTALDQYANMQIGGRNLVRNSDVLDNKFGKVDGYNGTRTVIEDNEALSKKHVEFECTTAGKGFYLNLFPKTEDKIGKTYTWSFWAKCNVNKSGTVGHEAGGMTGINLTTEWQKYSRTWVYRDKTYSSITFYLNWNVGEILYIRDFKIEEGNKATSWTPAPEDTQVQIDTLGEEIGTKVSKTDFDVLSGTVDSQGTQISENSEKIELKANQTTVNTLTGRVDQAEAAIQENADEIVLRATKSTVDALTERVEANEAELSVQADQIAARITEADADGRYATQTSLEATSNSLSSRIVEVSDYAKSGNLYLRGTGLNRNANRVMILNDNRVYDINSRGLRLAVIRRSDLSVVEQINYDTYGNSAHRADLTNKLNSLDDSVIVTLTSYDAITWDDNLCDAVARCGGSGEATSKARTPYAFVGIPGIGKGAGIEVFTSDDADAPRAEISTKIINGTPQGINVGPFRGLENKYSSVTQTLTAIQTEVSAKVDTDTYNSKISQLADDINLRVSKNDVVNQINVSTESILIAGNKVHITGETTIDDASIGSAAIAALDAGKITTGTLAAERIGAGAITSDKLDVAELSAISANLGNVTTGTLTGVTLNMGSGNFIVDPSGNLTTNNTTMRSKFVNGHQVVIGFVGNESPFRIDGPDGEYVTMNSSSFQIWDEKGNNAVTIADNAGLRGIDVNNIYSGYYTRILGGNIYSSGNIRADEYMRVGSGPNYAFINNTLFSLINENGENVVSVVDNPGLRGFTTVSGDSFSTVSPGYITTNGQIDAGANINGGYAICSAGGYGNGFYIGHNPSDPVVSRVTAGHDVAGLGDKNNISIESWHGVSMTNLSDFGSVGRHGTAFSVDVRQGDMWIAGSGWANHWNTNSLKELKQDIAELQDGEALAAVNAVDIRAYRYKKEAEQGITKLSYGPIIGDGFNTPEQMLSADHQGTDDHSALYLNMAATQDLFKKYQDAITRIASLEYEVAQLKGAAE